MQKHPSHAFFSGPSRRAEVRRAFWAPYPFLVWVSCLALALTFRVRTSPCVQCYFFDYRLCLLCTAWSRRDLFCFRFRPILLPAIAHGLSQLRCLVLGTCLHVVRQLSCQVPVACIACVCFPADRVPVDLQSTAHVILFLEFCPLRRQRLLLRHVYALQWKPEGLAPILVPAITARNSSASWPWDPLLSMRLWQHSVMMSWFNDCACNHCEKLQCIMP